MKNQVIKITKMGGLKCDNHKCDWNDMSIDVKDYKKYINHKCPKCGENVFTKREYYEFKVMLIIIKTINLIINLLFFWVNTKEEGHEICIHSYRKKGKPRTKFFINNTSRSENK